MAQLAASIVSHDEEFKRQMSRLLRAGGVPIGILEAGGLDGAPDLYVVDIRHDASSGMATIERLRAGHDGVPIFAIAAAAESDVILQAMRAGANEFFPWSPNASSQQTRAMEESFNGAVRRAAARREAASAGARQPCVTHVFIGAKGGAGTTTVSVNCAVELARLSKRPTIIVDLKGSLGEVALFLGVRPRFTVLDAIENLHRLDKDFLKELVSKHKSGLDILARVGFATLGLQTYLTAGPKESRAWTIRRGATAPEAAGVIHTDFQRGFIKAEVVSFADLVAAGTMLEARARGKVRMEGKDYVMQDGDVVEFRFNV